LGYRTDDVNVAYSLIVA